MRELNSFQCFNVGLNKVCIVTHILSRKAISQHCNASQHNKAAILEERMAINHSNNTNFDASIGRYLSNLRASKLYTAANMHENADRAQGVTAYLFDKLGRIRDSAYSHQSQVKSQTNQDIKKFNVPPVMLRARVLLLS
jgi:hypothetical protein